MPKGVLECLRKVTPTSGLLSFERFVAGLKICLLRSRAEALSQWQQQQQQQQQSQQQQQQQRQPRPPSAPTLDQLSAGAPLPPPPPPAARPHSVIGQQRTLSMPQLSGASTGDQPPPKPPRDRSRDAGAPPPPPPSSSAANLSRTQILTALQRWHRERVQRGRGDGKDVLPPADPPSSSEAEVEPTAPAPAPAPAAANPTRKSAGQRKREPRRHTLQNGIDYNMVSWRTGSSPGDPPERLASWARGVMSAWNCYS